MSKCDKDCFHCPFPDCINDEMDDEDYAESFKRERELRRAPAAPAPSEEVRARRNERSRQYYQDHKAELAAYHRAYRETHREELRARARIYYRRNRDRINAERRKTTKERKDQT